MGREIFEETGITATTNDSVRELIRGIRTHFVKIMKSKCYSIAQKLQNFLFSQI